MDENSVHGRMELSAIVGGLPIVPVGIPEAGSVLCAGDAPVARALALALALASAVILLRCGVRLVRSAIDLTTDPMASLTASVLPAMYWGWLGAAGTDVISCLFPSGSIPFQIQYIASFMSIGISIVNTIV